MPTTRKKPRPRTRVRRSSVTAPSRPRPTKHGKPKARATGRPEGTGSMEGRPAGFGATPVLPSTVLERLSSGNTTITTSVVGDPFGVCTGAVLIQRTGSWGFTETCSVSVEDMQRNYPREALRKAVMSMLLKRVDEQEHTAQVLERFVDDLRRHIGKGSHLMHEIMTFARNWT